MSYRKLTNNLVTPVVLEERYEHHRAQGFAKAKWFEFCEVMLERGFMLHLYEARQTFSKYITVSRNGLHPFKVRFSNHKPIRERELLGDCDFFVGWTHTGVRDWRDAVAAVTQHFNTKERKYG